VEQVISLLPSFPFFPLSLFGYPEPMNTVIHAGGVASLVFILSFFSLPASAQGPGPKDALERAGNNRPVIESFLKEMEEGRESPKRLEAARFLLRWMPTSDLATLKGVDLKSNLDLAFEAREKLPWGSKVPWPIFLHYVLPHRFAQEKADPWRARLWPDLRELVKDCPTMGDAALAVTNWCARRVKFKQTEWRDQNVGDTLKAGYGRCEEMMIVGLAAMRTVGIPARPCSAPWWVTQDNNHAWIEVWADGNWYYLGGSEATTALDKTWFRGPAQRAGMVVSVMYGRPEGWKKGQSGQAPTGDRIYKTLKDSSLINSTSVYAKTGRFRIQVLDLRGRAVPDCPFAVSVFNFGGLRALTRRRTDARGMAELELGLGEYFLSAGIGERRGHLILTTKPGKRQELVLVLQRGAVPPEAFWLRYPTTAEAERLARSLPKAGKARPAGFVPEQPTPPKPDFYVKERWPELDSLLGDSKEWRSLLADARGQWRELGKGLLTLGRERLSLAYELLKRASHLDRLEMDAEMLVDHVRGAAGFEPTGEKAEARERFLAYVLNQRIDREHPSAWRKRLAQEFAGPKGESPGEQAERIHAWIQRKIAPEERGRFGSIQGPIASLRARRATPRACAILAVAALRSLGIPARFDPQQPDGYFFFDHKTWQRLGFGKAQKGADPKALGKGWVSLFLRRGGKPFLSTRPLDFSRFEKGAWNPIRGLSIRPKGGQLRVGLRAGSYLLTVGVRNPNGDPWIQTRFFKLAPGEKKNFHLDLDLPKGSGIFRFPLARGGKALPELPIPGGDQSLKSLLAPSPTLLLVLDLDQEPSARALTQAVRAWPKLAPLGTKALLLYRGTAPKILPRGFRGHPLFALDGASNPAAAKAWAKAFPRLPSVLLLHKGGRPLLELEGFDLKLQDLLEQAARQLRN
jgi:transglutaminase-like putative cysteine protease